VAAVLAEVDVTRVVDLLEDVLDRLDVVFVGGADEVVVGDGKLGPEVAELGADPGVSLFFRAASAILSPCSSVPVMKKTS
jgi:hypothetical protein